VHDLIRNELGFKGVIMTDDMDMAGLADFISQEEAGLQALQAGNDMILSSSYSSQIPYILEAIKNGQYSEEQLNQSVERLLTWKVELGLIK
jgi:beta-N-acetylhexosaminidase